jgi:hypothetical protein
MFDPTMFNPAMFNPATFNPWLALTFRTMQLAAEAQNVVALRMLRLAGGGARAQTEANRMAAEKAAAIAEAQVAAAAAVMAGRKSHAVAGKALGVIRKRVRANKRRLSRR